MPPELWEFDIGGYQVTDKWLKDRKGRQLTYNDREHYKGNIAALGETGRFMGEIDAAIPGRPLAWSAEHPIRRCSNFGQRVG